MQCPACSSQNLSPTGEYMGFEHHIRFKGWATGLLGQEKDLRFGPSQARVCLDCGYLLLFAAPADVEKVKKGSDW